MKSKIKFLLVLPFSLFCTITQAQDKALKKLRTPKSEPVWVTMMEDSNVNYFKATKAFDDYWKHKEKPMEANDNDFENMDEEEKNEIKEFKEKLKNMTAKERNAYESLCYEYKRFVNWRYEVIPFVQPDGHVLTVYEQCKLWEQQQAERQ